jgi:hypothetical protein
LASGFKHLAAIEGCYPPKTGKGSLMEKIYENYVHTLYTLFPEEHYESSINSIFTLGKTENHCVFHLKET